MGETKMEITAVLGNAKLTLTVMGPGPISYDALLEEFEKAVLDRTLGVYGGVKARAADFLRLNRTTLVEKARKHGFPLKK